MAADIDNGNGDDQRNDHSDYRRQKNEQEGRDHFGIVDHIHAVFADGTGMSQSGADKPADQGMRGTGRDAKPPGEQVPGDGADQSGENHLQRNEFLVHRSGNGVPDLEFPDDVFRNEEGDEIEHGGPQNRLEGCQHLSGNNGGNGVCRIMKSIDKIENEREDDDDYQEGHGLI